MNAIMVKIFELLAKAGLDKLERALIFGGVLVTVLALAVGAVEASYAWVTFLFRWLHVVSGVMWIGLLWY
ncbi:MAG: hypothetical protein ACREV8_09990, partial [Gammaproteobacteria bacterium]